MNSNKFRRLYIKILLTKNLFIKHKIQSCGSGKIDLKRGFRGHKFAFDRYDFNGIDGKIQGGGKSFDFYGYNTGHVRVETNKRPDNEKSINFNNPIHYDIKN